MVTRWYDILKKRGIPHKKYKNHRKYVYSCAFASACMALVMVIYPFWGWPCVTILFAST
jgi:hypothetical protein